MRLAQSMLQLYDTQVVDFLTERLPASAVGGAAASPPVSCPLSPAVPPDPFVQKIQSLLDSSFESLWGRPRRVMCRVCASRVLTQTVGPSPHSFVLVTGVGIVILNAHRVQEASGESFAVRLLRAGGNAKAFVRALSDRPCELVRGFGSCDRVLKVSERTISALTAPATACAAFSIWCNV